jgi:DNA-binding MarR family transcriptional regulator
MTMSELARTLFLEASTVTRIVDRLVDADLVERTTSASDRRVCRVGVTDAGRRLVLRIRDDLIDEHVRVLQQVPAKSREQVITALDRLLEAFRARQAGSDCMGGNATPAGIANSPKGR